MSITLRWVSGERGDGSSASHADNIGRVAAYFVALVLTILVACVFTGCGDGKTTSKSNDSATKTLPPEYRTLADKLCLNIKPAPKDFRDNKSVAECIAELEQGVMALRGIQSSDPDIKYLAEQGQSAASDALTHLERLNALPKPPGAGEVAVTGFIHGFFGDVFGGYAKGEEAENMRNAIAAEAQAFAAAYDRCDALHQSVPTVAEKYSAPLSEPAGRIVVDFDESWGCWGPYDWFLIYNNGPALQDCTIVVQLTGQDSEARKNVHFVANWPTNSWMYARYEAGEDIPGRKVGRTTVTNVQKVDVIMYSPQFATRINYVYQGAEKDKKIAERCKDLKLSCRYQPFEAGTIWDTPRQVYFTLDGVSYVGKCRVDATLRRGAESKTCCRDFDRWSKGEEEEQTYGMQKGELAFDPDNIDVVVSFPGTNYKYAGTFNVQH